MMVENLSDVLKYYHQRAIQLLPQGWSWDGSYIDYGWGIEVNLWKDGIAYDSIFILEKGKGHLNRWFDEKERNYVTMTECDSMYSWLKSKEKRFTLAATYNSVSYQQISDFYRERYSERSRIPYMNHIDEGLYILKKLNCEKDVLDAYCLHPIYQQDNDLSGNWKRFDYQAENVELAILSMEYRNIANAYLPKRKIKNISEINLSPLEEVNQMLWVDKIQNRKDFEKYHLGTHCNSDGLKEYFQNWFNRLGITEDFYQECIKEIENKTGNCK